MASRAYRNIARWPSAWIIQFLCGGNLRSLWSCWSLRNQTARGVVYFSTRVPEMAKPRICIAACGLSAQAEHPWGKFWTFSLPCPHCRESSIPGILFPNWHGENRKNVVSIILIAALENRCRICQIALWKPLIWSITRLCYNRAGVIPGTNTAAHRH